MVREWLEFGLAEYKGTFTTNNLSDAYFFEISIALTEQLNLSVGYRNTDESKEATARYTTMPLGPTELNLELPVGVEFPFGLVLPAKVCTMRIHFNTTL